MMGAVKEGLSHANAKENIEEKVIYCEISHAIQPNLGVIQQKRSDSFESLLEVAATYSPTFYCSTIGVNGLNFSVRNGKRWNLTAITT